MFSSAFLQSPAFTAELSSSIVPAVAKVFHHYFTDNVSGSNRATAIRLLTTEIEAHSGNANTNLEIPSSLAIAASLTEAA